MKSSDDLFQLIQSLSKNEKGYFKKYAAMHVIGETNNYTRLFDAIEKQRVYDEGAIRSAFKGENFIRHLPSEKHYLYHLVLRSLKEYHAGSSVEAQLHELLHDMEILFEKGLHRQCMKLLRKAQKLAQQHEKQTILLLLYEWESRLLIALGETAALGQFIDSSAKDQEIQLEALRNTMQYRRLEERMFFLSKTVGYPRNKADKKNYERIVQHKLMGNVKSAQTFRSVLHYYTVFNFYYDLLGDHQRTYRYRRQLIDYADRQPGLVHDMPQRYVIALNNLLNSQDELRKTEEFQLTLEKLRSFPARTPNIQARIFAYTYNLEFTRYTLDGEFKKVMDKHKEVEEGLRKFQRLLHKEMFLAFHYHLFYACFGVGNFNQSLRWINHLLDDDALKVRRELYFFARIMVLVIHFELQNTDLLAYNIRNTYRFFMKQQRLHKFENVMLAFIRRSGRYNTPSETRDGFRELKKQIEELAKDPYEAQILSFFDIVSWLESKITRKSFGTVVREKLVQSGN